MSWSREQVLLLLNEYGKHPCLFAVKHRNYCNKHARATALEKIKEVVETVKKEVTINEIKTKFQGLKSTFLTEYRKYESSFKSGCGEEDIYQPSLWYFDNMIFIVEHCTVRAGTDTITGRPVEEQTTELENSHNIESDYAVEPDEEEIRIYELRDDVLVEEKDARKSNSVVLQAATTSSTPVSKPPNKRRKVDEKSREKALDDALKDATGAMNVISKAIENNEQSTIRNKSSNQHFGDFIISKMDEIEDKDIMNEIQEKITLNLFEGIRKYRNLKK